MARRWKLVPASASAMAASVWDGHAGLIADGYRLCRSTGFWRGKHDLLTARLVYRNETAGKTALDSIVVTIRNIRLFDEAAS